MSQQMLIWVVEYEGRLLCDLIWSLMSYTEAESVTNYQKVDANKHMIIGRKMVKENAYHIHSLG